MRTLSKYRLTQKLILVMAMVGLGISQMALRVANTNEKMPGSTNTFGIETVEHLNELYNYPNYSPVNPNVEYPWYTTYDAQDAVDHLYYRAKECQPNFYPEIIYDQTGTGQQRNEIVRRPLSVSIVAQTMVSLKKPSGSYQGYITYSAATASGAKGFQPNPGTWGTIEFNSNQQFMTSQYATPAWATNAWNYYKVFMHEYLHLAGLGHNNRISIMNPTLFHIGGDPSSLPNATSKDILDFESLNCMSPDTINLPLVQF